MTSEQTLIVLVLLAALVLFVHGRLRHDVVAFGALCVAALIGVVPEDRVLSGFGHPAVFTVAAVLILSRAVQISGILDPVARVLGRGDRLSPADSRRVSSRSRPAFPASAAASP